VIISNDWSIGAKLMVGSRVFATAELTRVGCVIGSRVSVGRIDVSVGLVHAARIAIVNKIYTIRGNVFRFTIPPFDLGILQIIHL